MVSINSIVKFEVSSKNSKGRFVPKSKGTKFSIAAKEPVTGRYISMEEAGQRIKDFVGKSLKERPAVSAETINQNLGINKSDKSLATLLSQAERRTQQAAEKAARNASKNGMVTVFDATKGLHVSATPAEAKAINAANEAFQKGILHAEQLNAEALEKSTKQAFERGAQQVKRRAAQVADKVIKKASKYGFVTVFDAKKGLYVSATPAEAKAIRAANETLKQGTKETTKKSAKKVVKQVAEKPSILKKIAKFGLIGLGIAALVGGAIYLFDKYKNDKSQADAPAKTPASAKPAKKTKPAKPVAPTEKEVKPEEKPENPKTEDTNKNYIVKKGDNLWNIAKQYLKDQHKDNPDYKPTNKEIAELTEKLIELNGKEYKKPLPEDSRKRVVIIHENENIKLSA